LSLRRAPPSSSENSTARTPSGSSRSCDRLATHEDPRTLGKALTGPTLGTYWRYRVGDWRLICDIEDSVLHILVLELGNRRDVYPIDYRD
jgi:mRNA-degrading endonuclease RelE of RelBE toxin-antitoxin system